MGKIIDTIVKSNISLVADPNITKFHTVAFGFKTLLTKACQQ